MSTFRVRLTQGDSRTGTGNLDTFAQATGTITGATNASPIVITSAAHGLMTGQRVMIKDVVGNTAANETWKITVISSSTFSLDGSTGNASYTSGGTWNVASAQRTMDSPGPKKTRRLLKDGETFVDCNYWKRFAYPQVTYDKAFIEVLVDDGAPYEDGITNTFARVYSIDVDAATTYEDNVVNILDDYGGPADMAQISVSGNAVTMRINGSDDALLPIAEDASETFNKGELLINTLEFDNSASGATNATVVVLVAVQSQVNS